jgi:hypothetical protein
MKPYGIGLIIILIAFAIGIYPAYVSYNDLANPPSTSDYQARLDEAKTASLIGLICSVIAVAGVLVFVIEFMRHEHGVSPKSVSSPTP